MMGRIFVTQAVFVAFFVFTTHIAFASGTNTVMQGNPVKISWSVTGGGNCTPGTDYPVAADGINETWTKNSLAGSGGPLTLGNATQPSTASKPYYTFWCNATPNCSPASSCDSAKLVVTLTSASCTTPWGTNVANGGSVTAYQSSSVNAPGVCTSETRTCSNGTLSGSYTNQSCTVLTPDLTAGNTAAAVSNVPGQSESFSASVSNVGNGTASNFPNIFQIDNSDMSATVATVDAGTIASLAAGASTGISGSYAFASPGTYNVRACANLNTSWGGSITESNSGNNCGAWQTVTVSYPPLSVSCTGSPGSAYVGQTVTWTGTISGGSGASSYSWSGTDGLSSTNYSLTIQKTYDSAGTKAATLSVTDTATGQTVSATCTSGGTSGGTSSGVSVRACTTLLTASATKIEQGQTVTLTWSVPDGSVCATSCSINGINTGSISSPIPITVTPTPNNNNYVLTCSGGAYTPPLSISVPIDVTAPKATISANPSQVASGSPTTVSWSSSPDVNSCTITKSPASSGWPKYDMNSPAAGIPDAVTAQTTYTIDCTNAYLVHATSSVIVNIPPQYKNF